MRLPRVTARPQADSVVNGDVGAARAAVGAVATTTGAVIPVFLVGGLVVQIGRELGFSPAGLGVAVALYFGASALTSLRPVGWSSATAIDSPAEPGC
jgi:hypothetical protein